MRNRLKTRLSFNCGLTLLALFLTPATAPSAPGIEPTVPLRRIILISCDTLSARHLTTYGYDKFTAVNLDSISCWGVTFQHCLAPSGWTLSSHMSMLTGLAPGAHRVGKEHPLADEISYLPEILAGNGFRCSAFLGKNLWLSPQYGYKRGFSAYRFQSLEDPIYDWGANWLRKDIRESGLPASEVSFFLFLHFMEAHSRPVEFDYLMPYWSPNPAYHMYFDAPVAPPLRELTPDGKLWEMSAYDTGDLNRLYDACIYYWDWERLLPLTGQLRRLGLLENSLLIITADHGEQIADHDGYFHWDPYVEVREVPLVMVWVGQIPSGRIVDTPVSLLDLAPTILDLAGLPPLPTAQGTSLRPLLLDPTATLPRRDFLVDGLRRGDSLNPSALVGQVDGSWWSLVATTDTTGTNGTFRPARIDSILGLFDLTADPSEKNDRQGDHPELVADLSRRLEDALADDARLAEQLGAGQVETIQISEEAEEQLRALGY